MKFDRVIAIRNNKTIYRDGDRCIKVFRCGYSPLDVMREAYHHTYAWEHGLAVPQLLAVTQYRDEWAIEMRYIRGKTLQQVCGESAEAAADGIRRFAALHAQLHKKKAPELQHQHEVVARAFTGAPDADSDGRDRCMEALSVNDRDPRLCHGDFQLSNVLIGENGALYIVDWPHAVQGNPCFDAAVTYLRLSLKEDTALAELYLSEYARASKRDERKLRSFLAPAAAYLMTGTSPQQKMRLADHLKNTD